MELIDVVLVLDDGVEIPAHRLVLASASPYFRAMFNVNMRESCEKRIFLSDVDSASVKALVDFAYTGKIDVISDNDVALFCAAHRLLFEDVVDYCCEGLAKHVNKRTCLQWLKFADQYDCQKLLSVARRHAAFHIVDLAQMDEFRRLSLEHVSRLLTSDELAVAREEEVWDIVLQWIQHDKENRKSSIGELAKSVRFSLIPEQFVPESVLSHPDLNLSASERDLPSPHRLGKSKVLLAAGGVVSTDHKNFDFDFATLTNTVEYYDHLWNVWKEFPSLNEERFIPGIVSLGESVYAVGGFRLHSVERYDSTQGRWVEDVAPMQESRTGGVLVYGDCIYAMGCNYVRTHDHALRAIQPGDEYLDGTPPNFKVCLRSRNHCFE
ncbi:kelch-like protein 3 [Oscarella lobularis]|uniref:kelch-like protein 3 n=1 Tax=Oscarella lobularis TaxID=121494 RepID=UPI00331389F7